MFIKEKNEVNWRKCSVLCELSLQLGNVDDELFVNGIHGCFLYKHRKNQILCEI